MLYSLLNKYWVSETCLHHARWKKKVGILQKVSHKQASSPLLTRCFSSAPESRWHLRAPRKTSTAQFWSHSTLRLQEPSHCHRTWGCSFQQEAKTAQAAAAHAEAMAVKAAEAQLRRHQSAAVQQQGEGGDKPASVEATFEQETKLRDELAKQLSQIS